MSVNSDFAFEINRMRDSVEQDKVLRAIHTVLLNRFSSNLYQSVAQVYTATLYELHSTVSNHVYYGNASAAHIEAVQLAHVARLSRAQTSTN